MNVILDERYGAIRDRLELLSDEEINRIIVNQDKLCLDTFNYNDVQRTYCPLALALNLHKIPNPTDESIAGEIAKRFKPVNVVKGLPGTFYTLNRQQDLVLLCYHILEIRALKRQLLAYERL